MALVTLIHNTDCKLVDLLKTAFQIDVPKLSSDQLPQMTDILVFNCMPLLTEMLSFVQFREKKHYGKIISGLGKI